jgi:hypothetical protein
MEFLDLVDHLISGIQHLELKVVYLRYLLSMYLPEWNGKMLRCDIFSDLTGGFWDKPAYQRYISRYHGGLDPMDGEAFSDFMWRLSRGEDLTGL